jgi:signal transduction histidine kinase
MSIEREIENDFQELKSSSISVSEKISFFRDNMRLVGKLSLLRVSLEYDRPETVNNFLGSESSLRRNFSKLYVLDQNKKFFTSNEENPEVFSLIESSKTFENVSGLLDSSNQDDIIVDKNSLIYIATKIKDENDQTVGYLLGEVSPSILTNEILRLKSRINADQIFLGRSTDENQSLYCQKIDIGQFQKSLCFQKKYKETFIDSKFIIILFLTTVLLALIFGFIYRIFFSKILKPFYDFLENLKAITTGTYTFISDHSKYPEIEMLIQSSNQIVRKLKSYQNEEIEKEKTLAVSRMATQAAHDIRSPLEVLKSLEDDLRKLPEEPRKRLKLGIARIEEIAFNLLQVNKGSVSDRNFLQSEDLLQLISSTCIEKNIEYRHLNRVLVKEELIAGYGLFSQVNRTSFKNIVSNIINNSIEATENEVIVTITLFQDGSNNIIKISDDGPGVEPKILERLLTETFTSKPRGNGLGLYNANVDIKRWDGDLRIYSSKTGTDVVISLPQSPPAPIFLHELNVTKYDNIIVVDDDPGFLDLWKQKLGSSNINIRFISSYTNEEKLEERTLVISDYDLGEGSENGIEILKKLPDHVTRILNTALSEDQEIRKTCQVNGFKLVPKSTLKYLPISFKKTAHVLIDDDKLMHIHWKMLYEKRGLEILTYFSVSDFLKEATLIDKGSIIYIDSNLSNDFKGEVESKNIYDLGFKTIYLTTGYTDFDIKPYPWIKDVLGKSPII